ncbi:hypothetical protein AB8810_23985 [Xanthomonas sp. NCPPB 3005]|uniref:hypothetical protein n=1 Tax=Xanthomonas sp. NCPPB 3005 TaxID=3240913 RepID=UPI0035152B49
MLQMLQELIDTLLPMPAGGASMARTKRVAYKGCDIDRCRDRFKLSGFAHRAPGDQG